MKNKLLVILAIFVFSKLLYASEEANPVKAAVKSNANAIALAAIKQPNVAGMFYPKDAQALAKEINKFLEKAKVSNVVGDIAAIISPHAGYEYSGWVAAYGYKAVKDFKFSTVVVIAPSHYFDFQGSSIWLSGSFRTPLGDIAVDSQLGAKIASEEKNIRFLPQAFSKEHSLEVQLPFLQTVFKGLKIVPIVIGGFDFENCQSLAKALARSIGSRSDVLIVASSDMSHYYPYDQAVIMDNKTLKLLENFDIYGLWNAARERRVELCGLSAVVTALLYAKEKGADRVEVLKYANSGDVTNDFSAVVGYSSVLIYKAEPEKGEKQMLSDIHKKKLLEIARQSLEGYVKNGRRVNFSCFEPELNQKRGAFVTLTKKGELRGCIGRIVADALLCRVIADMAIEAGSQDPRFYPVEPAELKDIEIEISVLSPIEKIDDINKIEVGKHGLIIRKGFNSGLLLPQVPTEYGWDRLTFLEQTCHKAGLPKDAWKQGAEISIFSADVFSEKSLVK